jgi:acyl-coenzyme A thioesterase PaaI-like protein
MNCKEKIAIPKIEGYECFACGTANPIGLNLQFYRLGDDICTEIRLGRYHVGWSDIAHGGIISTILDEVMSWTVLCFKRVFFVTRRMEIKYIRPISVGTYLTAKGCIVGEMEERNINVKGSIRDDHGNLMARSIGEFVLIAEEEMSSPFAGAKEEILSMIEMLPSW